MFFTRLIILWPVMMCTLNSRALEYHLCQDLNRINISDLAKAQVPELPNVYRENGRDREDGTWIVPVPLKIVWEFFLETPMDRIWKSKYIRYSFANLGEEYQGLKVGTRFYFNIKGEPTGYFCNLGFGIEITEMQPEKLIKYEYLDFSPAYGEQRLTFEAIDDLHTRLRVRTKYFGKDPVINLMYEFYHNEAIDSFMNSVRTALMARASAAP